MALTSAAPPPFISDSADTAKSQYRPAKDLAEFNALLPAPVDFVQGSSTGTLLAPPEEDKFSPINTGPLRKPLASTTTISTNGTINSHRVAHPVASSPKRPHTAIDNSESTQDNTNNSRDLHPSSIDLSFPTSSLKNPVGRGLGNMGNTCFLNSAVQCLVHTPPMLHLLLDHRNCSLLAKRDFCMTCSLRFLVNKTFNERNYFVPRQLVNNLPAVAKHLKPGRQEDSHEFLRYAIDAIQKSCLLNANVSLKVEPKIAHTTWIHKIFGGELRSRVHCKSCGYNSDTFDSILDLSLDIHNCLSLEQALQRFVAPDYLRGDDKYKCEKCKKHVNAEKRFTVNKAPMVLTIQLKRFTPFGKKMSHPVNYAHQLSLRPYMSEGEVGPGYSLYGIICHTGGGPNSGHYTAIVKGRDNRWHELDDDESYNCGSPLSRKAAYMLFYLRTDSEEDRRPVSSPRANHTPNNIKKEEDVGQPVRQAFIGPQIPPDLQKKAPSETTLAGRNLKAKIEAATNGLPSSSPSAGKPSLVPDGYGSDDETPSNSTEHKVEPSSSPRRPPLTPLSTPSPQKSLPSSGVPPASFYSTSGGKKRKHEEISERQLDSSPSVSAKIARKGGTPFRFGTAAVGTMPRRGRGPRGV